LFYLITKSGKR